MPITPIDALPAAPSRATDTPAQFSTKADALVSALATFVSQANQLATDATADTSAALASMAAVAAGGAMTVPYTFSTTTANADPGNGVLRLDNATQNAATTIRADLLGADGSTFTSLLDTLGDSTSTIKGFILLQALSDGSKWLLFRVTALGAPAGYRNITVVCIASSAASPFADTDSILMKFTRSGDKGDTGPTGNSGGLPVLATLTPAAAANVDALNVFTSAYDNYLIFVDGVKPATNDYLCMRVAAAGAVDAGANYSGSNTFVVPGTSSGTLAAGKGLSAVIHVLNANDASNGKVLTSTGANQKSAVPEYESFSVTSIYIAANAISGVRFYWSGGANFAATGKIRVLAYNNVSSVADAPLNEAFNNIGVPGTAGFGVGICPQVPSGFSHLPGATDTLSANYGNYQYSDGSIMCWIPAFYMRLAHADNPTYATYGVNSIDIQPFNAYPSEAAANADGYYLHRAFKNAGATQLGFFRDKYDCSLNGAIASSIALAMPMVSGPAAGQVGFTGATANSQTPANAYYGAIDAARSRGNSFFPETVFMADALTRLSEAHGQAATATTWCAWYSAGTTNFPKGNNNNALADTDDGTVTFTSAGAASYPNFAKTGSGSTLAKTTHNGQACGVADVNGNIYKINPGMTCIAASKTITGATQANPVQITIVGHGYATGDVVMITSVGGMTQLNDKLFVITSTGANTFTLDGTDGTAFGAFTAGGSATKGTFYLLKESVDIDTITSGTTLATDHWGATGVAALFDAVTLNFATTYGANAFGQRYGNAGNQVFGWASSAQRALSMAGMPAAAGMSVSGSNLMGTDYYYQYVRDQLCVLSRGDWVDGSSAGVRYRSLTHARPGASAAVGFAASCYL